MGGRGPLQGVWTPRMASIPYGQPSLVSLKRGVVSSQSQRDEWDDIIDRVPLKLIQQQQQRPFKSQVAQVEPFNRQQEQQQQQQEQQQQQQQATLDVDDVTDFVASKSDAKYQTLPYNTRFVPLLFQQQHQQQQNNNNINNHHVLHHVLNNNNNNGVGPSSMPTPVSKAVKVISGHPSR